jgi:hypothetical protein
MGEEKVCQFKLTPTSIRRPVIDVRFGFRRRKGALWKVVAFFVARSACCRII